MPTENIPSPNRGLRKTANIRQPPPAEIFSRKDANAAGLAVGAKRQGIDGADRREIEVYDHVQVDREESFRAWEADLVRVIPEVREVFGYFNNHYHGYAPENCLQLMEQLGLLSQEQKKAKEKSKVKQAQLGAFFS